MKTDSFEKKSKSTTIRLAIWSMSWTLSMALAIFGPLLLWESKALSIGAISLNFLLGIGMIWANIKQIGMMDELQRKIFVEANAFALGIGIVAGLSYSALDITNVIAVDAEIGHLVILIGITQVVAKLVGKLRYK